MPKAPAVSKANGGKGGRVSERRHDQLAETDVDRIETCLQIQRDRSIVASFAAQFVLGAFEETALAGCHGEPIANGMDADTSCSKPTTTSACATYESQVRALTPEVGATDRDGVGMLRGGDALTTRVATFADSPDDCQGITGKLGDQHQPTLSHLVIRSPPRPLPASPTR